MSKQEVEACQPHEPEKVVDVVLPAGDEAAEVVHPGEEPLHAPAAPVAAEFASVLRLTPLASVRRNQIDAVVCGEFLVERVRVVGLVTDEPRWQFVKEAPRKNLFHKLALGR